MTDYSQIYTDELTSLRKQNLDDLIVSYVESIKSFQIPRDANFDIGGLNIAASTGEALIKAISEKTDKVYCIFNGHEEFLNMAGTFEKVDELFSALAKDYYFIMTIPFSVNELKRLTTPSVEEHRKISKKEETNDFNDFVDFKHAMKDWDDFDIAAFSLGRSIGLFEFGETMTHIKHIFWSNNPIGNVLNKMLEEMVKTGFLLKNDRFQYKWNPQFERE